MAAVSGAQERMLAELERLKACAGMSFAQLQTVVPYSRSTLHRYFTGQAPIPHDALVSVVRACGGEVDAMVRLWEAAQADAVVGAEQPVRPVEAAQPLEAVGAKGPPDSRRRMVRAWFALACTIGAIMAVRPLID